MTTATAELRAAWALTVKSRATFDALSDADRAQFAAAGKAAFGQDTVDATFDWLEGESMSVFKVHLLRNDVIEWDVWINTAMDDGALFEPGTTTANGIGVSGMRVYDMVARRGELCAEVDRALRALELPNGMTLEDVLWVE